MGRQEQHQETQQHQEVIMIVVGGLLHQVHRSPHDPVNEDAEPVFEACHHEKSEDSHNPVVPQHPIPGKRLQEFKADEIEGELGIHEGLLHPACEDGSKGLYCQQNPEEDPEKDKGGVVNLGEEPFIQHSYP